MVTVAFIRNLPSLTLVVLSLCLLQVLLCSQKTAISAVVALRSAEERVREGDATPLLLSSLVVPQHRVRGELCSTAKRCQECREGVCETSVLVSVTSCHTKVKRISGAWKF